MFTPFKIIVKPTPEGPRKFCLFNEATGAKAGDRFFKGSGGSDKIIWPFFTAGPLFGKARADWWNYDTQAEADKAATKLQDYLNKKEAKKSTKAKDSAEH